MLHKGIGRIIYSQQQIEDGIVKAAQWINETFKDTKNLVLIGILKGCIPFFGKLITLLTIPLEIDFMVVSSFKGTNKRVSEPVIVTDILNDVAGKDVLIVEDIIDSGLSLAFIKKHLEEKNSGRVCVITLLDKTEGRKVELEADYSCFKVDNLFLVGYGLDYQEKLRNLPYIAEFKPE